MKPGMAESFTFISVNGCDKLKGKNLKLVQSHSMVGKNLRKHAENPTTCPSAASKLAIEFRWKTFC